MVAPAPPPPLSLSLCVCGVWRWWHGGTVVVACGGGVVAFAATACGGGRGGPCAFFISKNTFAESYCGLSAHIHREGDPRLSAKGPSPAAGRRERIAESKLSVKAPP
jgi:hypothetical protein